MIKKGILLFICLSSLQSYLYTQPLDSLMAELSYLQRLRLQNYSTPHRDSIFGLFDQKMQLLFGHPEFCDKGIAGIDRFLAKGFPDKELSGMQYAYAFMNNIALVSSDGNLRVFSWDDLGGGSYHSYTNYLQFKLSDGTCKTVPLDTSRHSVEVGYYKIYRLRIAEREVYALLGYGTYGGGHQHKRVKFVEIKEDEILECKEFYPNKKELVITTNRSQDPELLFDEEKQELTYKEYKFDDNVGFYTDDFRQVALNYAQGKLKAK